MSFRSVITHPDSHFWVERANRCGLSCLQRIPDNRCEILDVVTANGHQALPHRSGRVIFGARRCFQPVVSRRTRPGQESGPGLWQEPNNDRNRRSADTLTNARPENWSYLDLRQICRVPHGAGLRLFVSPRWQSRMLLRRSSKAALYLAASFKETAPARGRAGGRWGAASGSYRHRSPIQCVTTCFQDAHKGVTTPGRQCFKEKVSQERLSKRQLCFIGPAADIGGPARSRHSNQAPNPRAAGPCFSRSKIPVSSTTRVKSAIVFSLMVDGSGTEPAIARGWPRTRDG
jgi:hypothetical protein